MTTEQRIDALSDAAAIVMKARYEVRNLDSIHTKLCRVSRLIDNQAAAMLEEATGINEGEQQ